MQLTPDGVIKLDERDASPPARATTTSWQLRANEHHARYAQHASARAAAHAWISKACRSCICRGCPFRSAPSARAASCSRARPFHPQRRAVRAALLLEHRAERGSHFRADVLQPARPRSRGRVALPHATHSATSLQFNYLPNDSVAERRPQPLQPRARHEAAARPALLHRRGNGERLALLRGFRAGPGRHERRLRRAARAASAIATSTGARGAKSSSSRPSTSDLAEARPALCAPAAPRRRRGFRLGPGRARCATASIPRS